jgi:UDP-glucose 4-epimerase
MTRFLLDIQDGIDLIIKSLKYSGCTVIMKASSFRVKDLFEIYQEEFGLKFINSKPRTGEKIHEIMASSEEIRRLEYIENDNVYLLHPEREISNLIFPNNEYSSRDVVISKEDLKNFLRTKEYYKP